MPKLIEIAQEYVHLKGIEVKPVMIAVRKLIQTRGDKNIEDYERIDARKFIDRYEKVKTTFETWLHWYPEGALCPHL